MAAVTEGAHNSGAGVRGCAWRPLRDVLADCVGGSSEDGNSVASSFGLRDGLRQSGGVGISERPWLFGVSADMP